MWYANAYNDVEFVSVVVEFAVEFAVDELVWH
jgi:hypothetical protein